MIGIIVAEEKELIEVKNLMDNIHEKTIYEKVFYLGGIENTKVVLVKSNVGKVNSARITQVLIDNFDIDLVINFGSAGSVSNKLNIGDIVVSQSVVQYDFDTTAFGRKKGEIENIGQFIKVDDDLLNMFSDNVYKGVIASGDKFITDIEEKMGIQKEFSALCIEMEGASVGQVCYLCNKKFLIIRAITDKLDGSSKVDFENFLSSSSKKCAFILKEFIKKYQI